MQTYIAMLRGINVSGQKIIKMENLRASFAKWGFRNVKTYVQSGNVIFQASNDTVAGLSTRIEKKILSDFGFAVPVFVKTSVEMEMAISRNPFANNSSIDQSKLHITFLSGQPPKTAASLLQPLAAGLEQFRIIGSEIFLYCPNSYGNSKLVNTAIEKKLLLRATTRNWNTARTLLAMSQHKDFKRVTSDSN